jgi:hypothetical protein
MGWWSTVWRTRAEDWTFAWLGKGQVPAGAQDGTVEPEQRYLHVFLKSARVVDVRKGFTTFYGTVHSYTKLPHRSGGEAEFNVVVTPNALKNVDAGGVNAVIQLNQRLVGPVPYAGGDLELEIGLFSVAASNLAAPYLTLLESLSETAGVSYVSAALPFAGPILEGMKLLTGGDKEAALEIGFSTALEQPRLGYVAAIRAAKGTVAVNTLSVDPMDFRLLTGGEAVTKYPYIVVEVTARSDRADWHQIPELATAYKRIQEEYRAGRETATDEALSVFRRIALTCNDLLEDDARRLVDKVTAQYQKSGPPTPAKRDPGARAVKKELPDLETLKLYQ